MTTTAVRPVDDDTYLGLAADVALPVEQSPRWDAFDRAVAGRTPWGRFVVEEDGTPVAVVSLTEYRGRGFRYLWAKHGPVWLVEQTPERAARLRRALVGGVRRADRGLVFVRLHARDRGPDTHELLQTMTYDRTVVVDLRPTEDEILAQMRQRGRRCIRKGLKDATLAVTEETGLDRAAFDELYAVLEETGARDGFGISPADVYWAMLSSLGSDVCRIFVTRRDGRPLAWAIVTVHDQQGVYYYGASSAEGRKAWAADLLHWQIMQTLKGEGVESYDFMGIDSERAPSLAGVAEFKTKFTSEVTEVDGAWDVPVRPLVYAGLVKALTAKRWAVGQARRVVGRVRG